MSYILILCTLLLALSSLHKDKHHWVRNAVIVLILISGTAQVVKLSLDNRDARTAKTKAENDINTLKSEVAGLQGQVKAANEAQTQNTKDFLDNFNRLHVRIGELQTKVTTEELRKQLASVQNDLHKTQKALAPAPKATLSFSFLPIIDPPLERNGPPSAITYKSLPLLPDGGVHVEFTILNSTDVSAIDGEITLIICDQCKFAKEPAPFQRLAEETETQRHLSFQRLLPWSRLPNLSADVIPYKTIQNFSIGIAFRCQTCAMQHEQVEGTVHILR